MVSSAENYTDKYYLTIVDSTQIFEQNGEELYQVEFKALGAGQQVQIWFSGPVMESLPMHVTAKQMVNYGYYSTNYGALSLIFLLKPVNSYKKKQLI